MLPLFHPVVLKVQYATLTTAQMYAAYTVKFSRDFICGVMSFNCCPNVCQVTQNVSWPACDEVLQKC